MFGLLSQHVPNILVSKKKIFSSLTGGLDDRFAFCLRSSAFINPAESAHTTWLKAKKNRLRCYLLTYICIKQNSWQWENTVNSLGQAMPLLGAVLDTKETPFFSCAPSFLLNYSKKNTNWCSGKVKMCPSPAGFTDSYFWWPRHTDGQVTARVIAAAVR